MQLATCPAQVPPTKTDIGVQVQSSPMNNTVLEEALIQALKEPFQVHVQQAADNLEERLQQAKEPFQEVFAAPTPPPGAKDRLAYFDRLAAVKKLFSDPASKYEVPSGAYTMRVFSHNKKVVLKHFTRDSNSSLYDLEEVLLLAPVTSVTPRSELRVHSSGESLSMRYVGLSFNTRNADHADLLESFPVDNSFSAPSHYVIPQQELLNKCLRQELPAPKTYTAGALEEFASSVRSYLIARQDKDFSVS